MFAVNLFSNVEAFAGKTSIETSEAVWLPGISGATMIFQITSNSMSPTLMEGDMVICKAVENTNLIEDGQLYAVMIGAESFVRRVRRVVDYFGKVTHLQLFTENPNQFIFSTVDIQQVSKLLKVSNRMTSICD
jgi:phage repressor protein C with HTH and peptisase S24 domain